MYRKILIGFTDSEQGRDALELGNAIATATGAAIHVATMPPSAAGRPASGLAQLARSEAADLIVLGSTRRGPWGRVLPGATAERLLAASPCAVAVAPRGFSARKGGGWLPSGKAADDAGLRVIGVGYDGTPEAGEALQVAAELAQRNASALRVLAVARVPAVMPGEPGGELNAPAAQAVTQLRDSLDRAVAGLPAEVRAEAQLLRGFPVAELCAAAERGIDMLVLGSRGGGVLTRLLGSVSNGVIREAPCPVLIAPRAVGAPHPVAA